MAAKSIDRLPGETEAEFQKRYTREKMRRLRAKWADAPDVPKKEMLRGKTVSGLHVETNLRIIPALENMRKHNKLLEV